MKHITQPRQGESSKWISKTITTKLKSSKKVGVFVQNIFENEVYSSLFSIFGWRPQILWDFSGGVDENP